MGLFDNYFREQFFVFQNKKIGKYIWQQKIVFCFMFLKT